MQLILMNSEVGINEEMFHEIDEDMQNDLK